MWDCYVWFLYVIYGLCNESAKKYNRAEKNLFIKKAVGGFLK